MGFHQSTPGYKLLEGKCVTLDPWAPEGNLTLVWHPLVSLQLFSFTVNFYMIACQRVLFFLTPRKLKRGFLRHIDKNL